MKDAGIGMLLGGEARKIERLKQVLRDCREFILAGAPVGGNSSKNMTEAGERQDKILAEIDEALTIERYR